MATRKRPLVADSSRADSFATPEKKVPAVRQPEPDYGRWSVEETCAYLRREGLGRWEAAFRGRFRPESNVLGTVLFML